MTGVQTCALPISQDHAAAAIAKAGIAVFAWKGMGQVFNDAVRTYDLNLFMGVFIISATLTVLANLVADLLYGVVDPRIRIRK